MTLLLNSAFTFLATILLSDVAPPPEEIPFNLFVFMFNLFFGLCGGVGGLLTTGLTVWMLVHCMRHDVERGTWVWIILFFPCFGPFIYLFMRYLPASNLKMPQFITNMTKGRKITQLEMTAKQIGNPHQFVQLGDILKETSKWERAKAAYETAIEKEPENIQALWGAGLVAYELDDFHAAADYFEKVLKIDRQYKFGDVSLYLGKAFVELQKNDAAIEHLEQHIKRWPQPEARYLLATLYSNNGNINAAREQLEALLVGIATSPPAIARKSSRWESKAKRMLKRL